MAVRNPSEYYYYCYYYYCCCCYYYDYDYDDYYSFRPSFAVAQEALHLAKDLKGNLKLEEPAYYEVELCQANKARLGVQELSCSRCTS